MAEEVLYEQVETGDPDPLGLRKKAAMGKSDPLGLRAKVSSEPKQQQASMQFKPMSDWLNIPGGGYQPMDQTNAIPIDDHTKNTAQAAERVSEHIKNIDPNIHNLIYSHKTELGGRIKSQQLGINPKESGPINQQAAQLESQLREDVKVDPTEVEEYKIGMNENPGMVRVALDQRVKDLSKTNPSEANKLKGDVYRLDAQGRVDNEQKIAKNIEKLNEGKLEYDTKRGVLYKPEGFFQSVVTGFKQKNQLFKDYELYTKTDNEAAIIKELNEKLKEQDPDEPIIVPDGQLAEAGAMLGGQPIKPIVGAIGAGIATSGLGASVAGGGIAAHEMYKLGYASALPANYAAIKREHPDMPDYEAYIQAKTLAEKQASVDAGTGAAMGLVGARAVIKPTTALLLQKSVKSALKQIGETVAIEGLGGGAVGGAGQVVKNLMAQKAGIATDTTEGVAEQLVAGVVMTLGMSLAAKAGNLLKPSTYNKLLHGLSKAPDEVIAGELNKARSVDAITAEEAQKLQTDINEQKRIDASIRDDVPESERIKIQQKISQRNYLQKQLETLDESFHPEIKESIKQLNEDIVNISKGADRGELQKLVDKESKNIERFVAETLKNASEKELDGYFKKISEQAHDPNSEATTIATFGENIVNKAKELYPKEEPINTYSEKYNVKDSYESPLDLYLRFTEDANQDVKNKKSRWYDPSLNDEEAIEQGYQYDPERKMYFKEHTGLSGHKLKATNIRDAIKEIESGNWYKDADIDNWAIFEDDPRVLVDQDTPEGHTFAPKRAIYERQFGIKSKEEPKQSSISVIQPGEIRQPETIIIKPKEIAEAVVDAPTAPVEESSAQGQEGKINEGPDWVFGKKEGEPEMIGITHAEMDKVSRELGLPEYTQDPETFKLWERQAKDMLAKDPDAINKIINKLRKGDMPDPAETQVMKMHYAALKGKYNTNPTPELLAELNRTKNLYNISGRSEAKSLVARKGLIPADENSLADFHQRDVEYNNGAPLTKEQTAKSTEEYNKISKKQAAFDENKAKGAAKYAKEKAESKVKEWAKTEKKDAKKDYKTERSQILKDIGEKWKKASRESLGASILPYAKELAAVAPDIIRLVKNVIQDGITELPDIIKSVHSQVKEHISDITEKDIHDIIAGVYSEKKPPRSKLAAKLYETRLQAKLINELDQLLSGELPKSEEKQKQRNQKIEALRKQIKEVKNDLGLNERTMQQKLASLKGRYKTEIEEIKAKIDKGDYGPDEKPEVIPLDDEGKKLRDELLELKDERAIRLLKQQYANRSTGEKAIAEVGKALRTGRQIQSGFFDVSYPFRQTIVGVARQLLALPFKRENGKLIYTGFKSQRELRQQLGKMYQAFGSEKHYRRTMADIKEHGRFDVAKKSKLDIAELDTPLERFKEEEAQTSYAEKIPIAKQGVRMSNRAATVIANKMKFDIFNQLVDGFEQAGKTFKNSPELYKEAAKYANQLVGRGFLGEKLEMASPLIGHVLYSLRLQASRLQLLTNLINPRFYAKVPKEIRIEYIKDMTKFVLMGTAMLGLAKAAGLGVELDPRSSDFGSVKWGDTRFDIWGGFKQYVTLFSRLLTASTKSPETGEINRLKIPFSAGTPEHRQKTYGDLLLRFARTKASPEAGALTDVLVGETFDKKAVTAQGEAVRFIAPMIVGDVYDAWKDNGVLGAALTYVLATHGVGAQSHVKEGDFDDVIDDLITGGSDESESGKTKKGKLEKPARKSKPSKNTK